ncbi:MAG: hypothetical protein ACRDDZ_00345 [Marinifilaceae bacterium]
MKKNSLKVMSYVLCALTGFNACSSSDKDVDNGATAPNGMELIGEITEDLTLAGGNTYSLTGGFHVKPGATLIIEPGVTIVAKDDNIVDYILIEQGAKINAQGTADKPIVMTSELKEHGAWGGVHICGYAPINVTGATSKSEIGDATYGGDNAADNSGILRYIRLEYTGYAFSEEKEANGFTFYGVGNGTKVEFLQSYKGADDGFEWFGGTVNCNYLVATDNTDDSFDWTEGWRGKGQFWLAIQNSDECDCLIEADNNSKDAVASPISHPTIANLTLIGNGSTTNKRGVRLRAGTEAKLFNALIVGKPECLTTETTQTENSLVNGTSVLEYLFLSSSIACKENIYSVDMFTNDANNNAINQEITFKNGYVGTIAGGKDMSKVDSYFVNAPYKGAVSADNDWTKGWTK